MTLNPPSAPPPRGARTVGSQPQAADPASAGPGRRRALFHAVSLGLILAAVVPLAGVHSVWSADEGAMLYQATNLVEGGRWVLEHPFPAADPSGTLYPVHLASFAPDGGYIVLGKHVVVVWLFGGLHHLGGYPATLAASAGFALVAALASARLATRIDGRAAIPALWLTGVASPLFVGAYVAWAHTLGAALIGWGLVGLTSEPTRALSAPVRSVRSELLAEVTAERALGSVAVAAACLVRTEATLAAAGLTTALALVGMRQHRPTARWLVPTILAGVATVVGFGLDRFTARPTLGPVDSSGRDGAWGGLAGRVEGLLHTWFRPDFSGQPEHLLLLGSTALVIGAGILARSTGLASRRMLILLALALAALLARFVITPTALIPGLVVAFPILFAGLAQLRRADLARPAMLTPLVAVALYWLAVLATQYRSGGGGEWGGRYFALGIPAIVAVAVPPVLRTLDAVPAAARRQLVAVGAILVFLPSAMGILGMREARDRTAAFTDAIAASLVDPGDGGLPVVVSTLPPAGRWSWEQLDRGRWLRVSPDDLPELRRRLAALGIERFVFVSERARDELDGLGPTYQPTGEPVENRSASLAEVVVPLQLAGP